MTPLLLDTIPSNLLFLQQKAQREWAHALQEQQVANPLWPDSRYQAFIRVCTLSDFVLSQAIRDPQMLIDLVSSGQLDRTLVPGEIRYQLSERLTDCNDEASLLLHLRQFRNRQQVRIIWRDLIRQAELSETCRDLSAMADACTDLAYHWLYQQHCQLFGTPIGRYSKHPQQLIILGMGKLGAYELNLSSDVDLIFTYPEAGETEGAKRSLDNQEFFTRLGQKLIKALDTITVDGFAFRVDMRLRPYGSSGPLVFSFNAIEQYYQNQGRDWERYAMIKARVVAGDQNAGASLLRILRPFIWTFPRLKRCAR